MSQATSDPARTDAADQTICFDLPCSGCGYNLRGLDRGGTCPECSGPVQRSLRPVVNFHPPAQVRWARAVTLGLLLWLFGSFASVGITLIMPYSGEFGGAAARVNYIGPKVWGVPMIQRALGYEPGVWGVNAVTASLTIAAGIVLLTTSPTDREWREPVWSMRFWARWAPLILVGGFLGLTLGCEGVPSDDPQVRKFVLAAVAGVEFPSTILLYLYLRELCRTLGLSGPARTFGWSAILLPLVFIGSGLMLVLGNELKWDRNALILQLAVSAYMAVSLCCAAAAMGGIVRLIAELVPIAARRINPVSPPAP